MTEQWQELKETIIELRDNNGTATQQEVCKFLANYMDVLEKQMQEPCDAISRQAVDTLVDELARAISDERCCISRGRSTATIMQDILDIPSVKPQEPKTGHWIMPVQDDGMSDPMYYQVRCSKCGFDLDPQTWHMELHQYDADKYCPKCGTPMIEPQESEDKE